MYKKWHDHESHKSNLSANLHSTVNWHAHGKGDLSQFSHFVQLLIFYNYMIYISSKQPPTEPVEVQLV